jgi:hypothetical protein
VLDGDEMSKDEEEFKRDEKFEGGEVVRDVCTLSLKYFRSKLVQHFDIMLKQGKIVAF